MAASLKMRRRPLSAWRARLTRWRAFWRASGAELDAWGRMSPERHAALRARYGLKPKGRFR